jgi:hypothetical protein
MLPDVDCKHLEFLQLHRRKVIDVIVDHDEQEVEDGFFHLLVPNIDVVRQVMCFKGIVSQDA